jgi:hypothetical protein
MLVTQVIVVANSDTSDAEGVEKEHIGAAFCERLFGGTWKQTSYNGNKRKNYAGIGFTYNADIDAFVPPKPFNSWTLNNETAQWEAPVAMPEDAGSGDPPKILAACTAVWNGIKKASEFAQEAEGVWSSVK